MDSNVIVIRSYRPRDEGSWLHCRVVAFLETAYYDDVVRMKPNYSNPAIELVGVDDGRIVGLLDVECDTSDRTVCSPRSGPGGMMWHLAVHPKYQRRGIGGRLLREAEDRTGAHDISRLEAWTRDDAGTVTWYRANGFERVDSYLHVYLTRDEAARELDVERADMTIRQAFAQYTGDAEESVRSSFDRVHECQLFERQL